MKDTIRIVMASDNNYAVLIAALLKSIEINHKTPEYLEFYIISDGIKKSNIKKINAIIDTNRSKVIWINQSEAIPSHIKLPLDKSGFPLTTYLRIFVPTIVPAASERAIYLDVDMILEEDISKLWHTNIGDYIVGAVRDISKIVGCGEWGGIPNYKELGMKADDKYFNAGLLVIDIKKWINNDITNKFINAMNIHKKKVVLGDQYGLNVVLYEKWFELDNRWNSFSLAELPDPFLIHYLDIKPIFSTYKASEKYKQEFYRYLSLTPYKNFKPINGIHIKVAKARNKIKKYIRNLLK